MKSSKSLLRRFKIGKAYNLVSMPAIQLTEEEADRFIDYIVDVSVMKDFARIERMTQPQKNIRAIGFGDARFLYRATEFNESKYKKQWAHNVIQLNTQKARGAIQVLDDDLEDIRHIESEDAYMDHLMKIVTKKIANELGEAYYIADTHGLHFAWASDDIRGMWDGWRYQINHSQNGQAFYNNVSGASQIKEACLCESGAGCSSGAWDPDAHFQFAGGIAEQGKAQPYKWEFKYHQMIKNMPYKYKMQGMAGMNFLNSDLVTADYLEALSDRGTALGDAVFQGNIKPAYNRVPIVDVPLMPTNLGQDADGTYGRVAEGEYTDVLLTPKDNLIIGIQRDIKIETQRVAADEATYVFYSLRTDVKIENVNAIVFMRCLTHRC